MQNFAIVGRHPELSLAEWRAVRPNAVLSLRCGAAAVFQDTEWDGASLMRRLGGTVKLGDVVYEGSADALDENILADVMLARPREPRIIFGFAVYDAAAKSRKRIEMLPLKLKRELKRRGHASRWVTGDGALEPSPAAVAKLKLTTEGYDLVVMVNGSRALIGLTTHVQDADAWSLRDYGRPARDDMRGMLPPKLARMMVNVANVASGETLLDPFCGVGTISMEAALATDAKEIIGSDIDQPAIDGAEKNTAWLVAQKILSPADGKRLRFFVEDVRELGKHFKKDSIDAVVTEGYLGPPLSGHETKETLGRTMRDITTLWRDALAALHPLLNANGRVVGIWPSFKSSHGTVAVEISSAELKRLGFVLSSPLFLYQRPDQRVARHIFQLRKT